MSCSTTSLTAKTSDNSIISEDPYVFTETAPTTPPIHFNNSQKSRSRLLVKEQNASTTDKSKKVRTTNKGPAFTKIKKYGFKTQTPASVSIRNAAFKTSAVLGVLNTNEIKYGAQSLKRISESNQTKVSQHIILAQNENSSGAPTFVAVQTATATISNGRTVQQQKSQIQQKNCLQQQEKKSQTTTSLSHTPSLWQTPLLLDKPTTMEPSTTTTSNAASVKDGATPTTCVSTLIQEPLKISFQPPTPTLAATALITPISIPAISTTPATAASMAPLHLIMPSATPLPPSNFHNTTLAQHLQKVQCLKNSKKTSSPTVTKMGTQKGEASSLPAQLVKAAPKNTTQHSTTDLNEIPVNVIFRSPTKNNEIKGNSNKDSVNSVMSSDDLMKNRQTNINTSCNDQVLEIGLSTTKQSSEPSQKRKYLTLTCYEPKTSPNVTQSKQCKLQKSSTTRTDFQKSTRSEEVKNINSSSIGISSKSRMDTTSARQQKSVAKRKTNGSGQKSQKRNRKNSPYTNTCCEEEQCKLSLTEDTSPAFKAVAVIRLPYKEFEEDVSHLAEESVLPYCVQRHWFNANEHSLRSARIGREERIIEYKNLLRRQAMQLLSTRSLQRLPCYIARKRLLCVDALLRKYRDHNKTVVGKITKRCDIENCGNSALEMATYCQQHITKNTKQSIFVKCSAKNLIDDQKMCDVPVLNIQKSYSVPLCFIHSTYNTTETKNANNLTNSNGDNASYLSTQINLSKRVTTSRYTPGRKRKAPTSFAKNSVNKLNANVINANTLPLCNEGGLKRKSSNTSLESIASNSFSSFGSTIPTEKNVENVTLIGTYEPGILNGNFIQQNMQSPPSLAVLSNKNDSIRNHKNTNGDSLSYDHNNLSHREDNVFGSGTLDSTAEQEINKLVAQFAMAAAATATPTSNNNICNSNNNNSFNYMNTNSNSNLTSSGVGSSSSLPSTDELLTQDMLTDYASSSEDTGLGELSENELIGASGGCGGGLNEDDVSPDEIPLGDTRLLEENDLANVFAALPVNLNELFTTVVRQDERDEVERALEIADKHLKTLQQTIGSDSDFLADFLNVNDDMLADPDDICSKMEIVSSVLSPPESLDTATLYLDHTENVLNVSQSSKTNTSMAANSVGNGNANNPGVVDIRGLLQT